MRIRYGVKIVLHLNNYFRLHVCLSFRQLVSQSVRPSHFQISLRLEVQRPNQTATERGEAELRILNFKTSWSEFQQPSKTAAERGEAELHILYFKTTLSEYQKPSQTAPERGEAELRILNFKNTWSVFQNTTAAE